MHHVAKYAYVCIHMYSYAFKYIHMHSFAFSCLQLVQEDPAQLGNLRGVLGRAAHLGRELGDGMRRDCAVLVAGISVLNMHKFPYSLGITI